MRRLAFAVSVLIFTVPIFAAEETLRLEGIAFAEGAAKEIQIQVWALGDQVAEHPEWQFEAVFGGIVTAGKAFSVDLGEARLPVQVELAAESHCAVALKVVIPEQLKLPPAWLRTGRSLKVSIASSAKTTEEAVVWGEVAADALSRDPRRWSSIIAHRPVKPGTSFDAAIPPESHGGVIYGVHPYGHFGRNEVRWSGHRPIVRLEISTVEVPIKVWDHRGRTVAGVWVAEASSPFETAAVTDEEGRAKVRIPIDGLWKIVALHDEWMGTMAGRGNPEDELAVDLVPRTNLTLTWAESAGQLVLEPSWLPRALGGHPSVYENGTALFPKIEMKGFCNFWSQTIAYGYERFDGDVGSVVLNTRAAVRIDGRVITTDGDPSPGLPVWIRLDRRAVSPYMGMFRIRGASQPLHRPWLPWAVSESDGSFSVTGLPPSEVQAEVLAPGLPTARGERLTGEEGNSLETTVVLRPGATLGFRATDPNGAPLDAVVADIYRSEKTTPGAKSSITVARTGDRGDPELSGSTDVEGRAVLTQVPVGLVRLRLSRPGLVTRTFDRIEVLVEGTDLGDLFLEPGVTLRGTTVGADGEPVANAEVAIDTRARMQYFVAETTSDDEGAFSIPDLAASGIVYLQARAEGFVPDAPVAVEMPPEGDIEVAMAAERRLEGVVLNARDDAPVAGARVFLEAQQSRDAGSGMVNMPRHIGNETTDSSGNFVVDGIAGGSQLELTVSASGLQRGRKEVVVPADVDPEPVVVRLEPGLELLGRVLTEDGEPAPSLGVMAGPASQTFDVRSYHSYSRTTSGSDGRFLFDDLTPGPVVVLAQTDDGRRAREVAEAGQSDEVVLRFEPGLTIDGIVLDPESAPVPAAFVAVNGECAQNFQRCETTADGRFELIDAKPGPCRIFARAEGFTPVDREIEVPEGGLSNLELRLERGATVIGQVRGVATSDLEGCRIYSDDGASTEIRMDGSFRLDGVGPGEREITARIYTSDRTRSVRATVPESGEMGPVIIDFASGLTLSGRVLRGGDGVPRMLVTANGVGTQSVGNAISGPEGRWKIEGLDPGEFQVAVQSQSGEVLAGDHVVIEGDTEIDLQIGGGSVAGRVVEADTYEPVEEAKVMVSGSGLPPVDRRMSTDGSGFFEATDLADGDYVVRAEAPERSPAQQTVSVRGGMAGDVILPLEKKQATVLVVRGPDGGSPSTLWIASASHAVLGPFLQVSCSAGGMCEVDQLAPGQWTLFIGAASSAAALVVADLPQNEVPVTLRRTGKLELRTASASDGVAWQVRLIEAASGVVVPFNIWRNPGRGEWVPVGASGLTVSLPEGEWRIETFTPDGTQGVQQATVTAGGTTEVTLE